MKDAYSSGMISASESSPLGALILFLHEGERQSPTNPALVMNSGDVRGRIYEGGEHQLWLSLVSWDSYSAFCQLLRETPLPKRHAHYFSEGEGEWESTVDIFLKKLKSTMKDMSNPA